MSPLLRMFIAARGLPSEIYSANGGKILASEAWIHDLLGNDDDEHFRELDPQLDTKWFTNPPETPHWGGTWQMMARDIKRTLHRTVGDRPLTYSEYRLYLNEAAASINSRPLTSAIESGVSALTPGCPPWGRPTACLTAERSKNMLFAVSLKAKSCTTLAAREWFQPSRLVLENVERILLDHPSITPEVAYPFLQLQDWIKEMSSSKKSLSG